MRADELEKMEKTPVAASVIHDESLCPIVTHGYRFHALCWRLEVENKNRDSALEELCATGMSDEEMFMLLSARDLLIEGKRYALRFDIEELRSRQNTVLRESTLLARLLNRSALSPGTFRMMPDETLTWSLETSETSLWLRLLCSVTSDEVMKRRIVETADEWDVDVGMELIEDFLGEALSEHFGRNAGPSKSIEKYGKLMAEIRSTALALKRKRNSK